MSTDVSGFFRWSALMADFMTVIDRFGVSLGLLVLTAIGIWRGMVWFAPRVSKVIDSHCEFVRRVADSAEIAAEQAKKQTEVIETLCKLGEQQGILVREIHKTVHRA